MSLVRKAEVELLVRHYKPYLGLADWGHVVSMDMGREGESVASVMAKPHQKTFIVVFAPRVFAASKDRFLTLEGAVLHELLHVCIWPMLAAVSKGPQRNIQWAIDHLEEPFVDGLARTLARYLPKPRRAAPSQ